MRIIDLKRGVRPHDLSGVGYVAKLEQEMHISRREWRGISQRKCRRIAEGIPMIAVKIRLNSARDLYTTGKSGNRQKEH